MKALVFTTVILASVFAQAYTRSVYNVIFETRAEASAHCGHPDRVTAYYKFKNHKFTMAGWVCQKAGHRNKK